MSWKQRHINVILGSRVKKQKQKLEMGGLNRPVRFIEKTNQISQQKSDKFTTEVTEKLIFKKHLITLHGALMYSSCSVHIC